MGFMRVFCMGGILDFVRADPVGHGQLRREAEAGKTPSFASGFLFSPRTRPLWDLTAGGSCNDDLPPVSAVS
jgi:hypothetical protein